MADYDFHQRVRIPQGYYPRVTAHPTLGGSYAAFVVATAAGPIDLRTGHLIKTFGAVQPTPFGVGLKYTSSDATDDEITNTSLNIDGGTRQSLVACLLAKNETNSTAFRQNIVFGNTNGFDIELNSGNNKVGFDLPGTGKDFGAYSNAGVRDGKWHQVLIYIDSYGQSFQVSDDWAGLFIDGIYIGGVGSGTFNSSTTISGTINLNPDADNWELAYGFLAVWPGYNAFGAQDSDTAKQMAREFWLNPLPYSIEQEDEFDVFAEVVGAAFEPQYARHANMLLGAGIV